MGRFDMMNSMIMYRVQFCDKLTLWLMNETQLVNPVSVLATNRAFIHKIWSSTTHARAVTAKTYAFGHGLQAALGELQWIYEILNQHAGTYMGAV